MSAHPIGARTMRGVIAVLSGATLCLAALAAPAFATVPTVAPAITGPTVQVKPAVAPPGTGLTVSVAGFTPFEAVDLYVDTTDVALTGSGAGGSVTTTVQIPASAAPGVHWLSAAGRHSGLFAQKSFTVRTDWPMRSAGPAHRGWNSRENTLSATTVGGLDQDWARSLGGAVYSSPAVVGGVAYVGSDDYKVYAVNVGTGIVKWSHATTNWVNAAPAVVGSLVYAGSYDGNMYALRTSDGSVKWTHSTGGGILSSATVVNGVVYVGSYDGAVYALDAATGALRWSYQTGSAVTSSPAVTGGVVYIGSANSTMYALDAATGAVKWTYTTGGSIESSPTVSGGVVYVGSDDGNLYALKAAGGALSWYYTLGSPVYASPAVVAGTVYIGSYTSFKLLALDARTGALTWSFTAGSAVLSPPSVANGVVYAGSDDGYVYAVDAGSGRRLWSAATGAPVRSSPAVADGAVTVGSADGSLYHYTLAAGTRAAARPAPRAAQLRASPATSNQLWSVRDGGPSGFALAAAVAVNPTTGTVYVTGESGLYSGPTSDDYATAAYSAAGARLWSVMYNSAANGPDVPVAIAVNPSNGNVYVAGYTVGSSGADDYQTVAYSDNGVLLWTATYDGPAQGADVPTALAVDPTSGNVYVTGYSPGGTSAAPTADDFATVGYSATGTALWVSRYDGTGHGVDDAAGIAVDPASGKVYVTGRSTGLVGDGTDPIDFYDFATVAYTSAGTSVWTQRYNGLAHGNDESTAISVDPASHDVYVTGYSIAKSGAGQFATIGYKAAGTKMWIAHYQGGGVSSSPTAIAVDANTHRVYVTGASRRGAGNFTNYDYVTTSYDATGTPIWSARDHGPGTRTDVATALAVDPSDGNVYVTGRSQGRSSGYDYSTTAYSGDGVNLWTSRYTGSNQPAGNDEAVGVAVDPSTHRVYVTGTSASKTGEVSATVAYAG